MALSVKMSRGQSSQQAVADLLTNLASLPASENKYLAAARILASRVAAPRCPPWLHAVVIGWTVLYSMLATRPHSLLPGL